MLRNQTIENQQKLASYCRTGNLPEIPGIKEQHVQHYRRLVFNIVEDCLASSFPLAENLMTPKQWRKLVDEFFENHPCQSYQVWQMPEELIVYMEKVNHELFQKYPALQDLLYFEWMECYLYMMPDIETKHEVTSEINWDQPLVLNPEVEVSMAQYPIHLRNAKYISLTHKGTYFYAGHRHPESGKVVFTNISNALVLLIEKLNNGPESFHNLFDVICQDLNIEPQESAKNEMKKFIEKALETKLILGFKI